ncbi:MAG: diacylglycerol kinase family lipid kinase [Acidobacteria bacterium]|nr:diacylglycerol kinase family lipid kinase [Acidobacteriota bacterium]
MEKTAIIFNPAAGRASQKKINFAVDFLSKKQVNPVLFTTEKKFDAENISERCLKENYKKIIIAGGDGTINEAIQPIVFSKCTIGILPLGTANVLAREIGIPLSFKKALRVLIEGKERKVSVGKIIILPQKKSRYFLLMCGIGFDAEVVNSNSEILKKNIGRFSYVYSALKTLFSYTPEKLNFKLDKEEFIGYSALVSNSSRYGGNFKIAKTASIFEPELHSIIMENDNPLDIVKVALSSLFKSYPAFEGLHFRISKRIEITGNAKIQLDGDFAGTLPCLIEAVPDALSVVC